METATATEMLEADSKSKSVHWKNPAEIVAAVTFSNEKKTSSDS